MASSSLRGHPGESQACSWLARAPPTVPSVSPPTVNAKWLRLNLNETVPTASISCVLCEPLQRPCKTLKNWLNRWWSESASASRLLTMCPEREIQKACLQYLKARGIFCWRQNNAPVPAPGGGFRRFVGMPGLSDILGILPGGKFLAVEVKRPKKEPTLDQLKFLEQVTELGGLGCCVHSVEELHADLTEYEKGPPSGSP